MAATLGVVWVVAAVALVAMFPREEVVAASAPADAAAAPHRDARGRTKSRSSKRGWRLQPRVELGVPANGARVVVVKFNDYQCPACRQAYIAYKTIQQKYESQYPGQVAFVNVDYPLESECNTGGIHSSACEAAVAVRLARARNRHREMEEWLFDNQATLTRDRVKEGLAEIAQVTDFDARYTARCRRCAPMRSSGRSCKSTAHRRSSSTASGSASTLRPSYFDAAIAYELKKASGTGPQGSGPVLRPRHLEAPVLA